MKSKLILIFIPIAIITAVLSPFVITAELDDFYPVYESDKDVIRKNNPKAIIVGDITSRRNAVIFYEFSEICSKYEKLICVCGDSSNMPLEQTEHYTDSLKDRCYLFKAKSGSDEELYALLLKNNGELLQKLEYSPKFKLKLDAYLGFLNGDYGADVFDKKLKEASELEKMDVIIPRLNLILMLEKKGMRDKAVEELDKVDIDNNTDEDNLILVGQTYLRLKSPEKALKVFSMCETEKCKFYKGLCFYLMEDFNKAKDIFTSLKNSEELADKVEDYLEKIEKNLKDTGGDADEK